MRSRRYPILLVLALAAPASARLTGSYIRDNAKQCQYDDPRGAYTDPVARIVTVDRNEDCPASPLPPVVPALATLDRSSISGGRRVCGYVYAQRLYYTSIDVGSSCTYTPR